MLTHEPRQLPSWLIFDVRQRMKRQTIILFLPIVAMVVGGCATSAGKRQASTLPAFEDRYRWHAYHLTREASRSQDGIFQLVGVSREGDIELLLLSDGSRRVLKARASAREIIESRMPLRVIRSDFDSQSADFEWLTTN